MSQRLINHSSDLKKLRDEGYEIEVRGGYAFMHNVPYVNSFCEIKRGTLASTLTLAGEVTTKPDTHVMYFCGDYPCHKDGTPIESIRHVTANTHLIDGLTANHSFSSRPPEGYPDYYEKFTTYAKILSAAAYVLDNTLSARTFRIIEDAEDSVLVYRDTNSSRSNIEVVNTCFKGHKVGIIGVGGTGSYILDHIAKTPVAEIHLFDGDVFLQHNAFRSPGAHSIEQLGERKKKVEHFGSIYDKMHRKIIQHNEYIDEDNLNNLIGLDFIFICIDKGPVKKDIIELLVAHNIPFSDTGIGIKMIDNRLLGHVRVTSATKNKYNHLDNRISYADSGNDEYSTNIQIAELNALNAALAVIKWKKFLGYYHDENNEHHTTYSISSGGMSNSEFIGEEGEQIDEEQGQE